MRRLLAPLLCVVLLSGCAGSLSDPDKLRDLTARVVAAANDKDPSSLRAAIAALRTEVQAQEQSGTLERNQATVILRSLAALEKNAPLLTASPTPSPTPSLSPTPSPTPSVSPTPSPTPSVSPTPSPTPPSPTPSPTMTVSIQPTLGVGLNGSPSAAATP